MNRFQFFLKAKTQYNLHSPFVFHLYREVLFAPLDKVRRKELGIERSDLYGELLYKLTNHLRPDTLFLPSEDPKAATIVQKASPKTITTTLATLPSSSSRASLIIFPHPHTSHDTEEQWHQICQTDKSTASIDLYYAGIVLFDPKLSKQHFLLRK